MYFFKFIFCFFWSSLLHEIISKNHIYISDDDVNKNLDRALNLSNNLNILVRYLNINNPCVQNIKKHYQNNTEELEKLYRGSSKGFIDLNSFSNCINDTNNQYFTVYPNYDNDARINMTKLDNFSFTEHKWIFGVCLAKDLCSEEEMKVIVEAVNNLFNNTIFKLYDRNNINVIEYRKKNNEIITPDFIFPRMIPLFFFFFQIIFIIVKIIPVKLFGWCLKRRYIRSSKKEDILFNKSFNDQISLKIKKCFSISEIFDDLTSSKKNELFQDGDMTYIKGIKGIGLFLFIIGFNFVVIYNHLLCKTGIKKIEKFMNTNRSALFYGCLRLAPALILSSSGYSLSYKFINFLDKKLANFNLDNNDKKTENNSTNKNDEKISDDKIEEKKENFLDNDISEENKEKSEEDKENSEYKSYIENSIGIKFYTEDISKKELNTIFKGQKIGDDDVLSETPVNIIPYSFYFNFSLRQIHKLFLIPLGILVFKYSVPLATAMLGNPLMQILYQDFYQKLGPALGNYLYYGSFLDLFRDEYEDIYMMRVFSIPMCEFNFFIICSIIIFIGYKKKWRIDIISIIIALVFFIFKIIYIMTDIEKYNPGMYYVDSSYQRFFFNPVFNFDFYLIGVLFGLVNYVVQNDLAKKESLIKERPFSGIPIYISKKSDYKKNKNYIYFIIVIMLFIFFLFFTPQYFKANFKSVIEEKDPGYLFAIISSIDIEFITICFHYLALSSYVSGRNIFFDILISPIFSYSLKLGFWICMATPSFTYIVLYYNDATISLNFITVIINSAINLVSMIIISVIFFFIMEMPYKKLIKLYFNISSELNKVLLDDEAEADESANNNQEVAMNELSEADLNNNNNDANNKEEEDEEID